MLFMERYWNILGFDLGWPGAPNLNVFTQRYGGMICVNCDQSPSSYPFHSWPVLPSRLLRSQQAALAVVVQVVRVAVQAAVALVMAAREVLTTAAGMAAAAAVGVRQAAVEAAAAEIAAVEAAVIVSGAE